MVKKTESTEVVVKQDTALASSQNGGILDAPSDELIIPRAKLLQALSPEIVEGMEGLKPGMIISNLTKEALPAKFSPFFFFMSL